MKNTKNYSIFILIDSKNSGIAEILFRGDDMIDNIKKLVRKIDIKKYSKEFLALGVFVVALSIYLITNAFAALTPTKSVIITSEKTSYEENEPGSWQVEKSGKWISKGRARVTFDVDTTLMTEDKDTDIIFVLDISGSMSG